MTLAEMPFVTPDLRLASAEIFVLAMSCLLLILDLFIKDKKRTVVFALTQLTLLVAAVLSWKTGTEQVMYTFSKMYVADLLSSVSKVMVFVIVFATLCYSRRYVLDRPNLAKGEFYVLILLATLGMMVMISANHFVTVYVGIELLSLSLYALVAMNRDSVTATEAGMKYFILGALASGLLLYGMSMIYGATGSLEITTIAQQVASGQAHKAVLGLGLVFLIAGIGFKLGVVPFHMWIPDVYHGAPTVVTLFIGSAPKLAAFAVVFRLLVSGLVYVWQAWQPMLLILALLSMAVGNFAAVAQTNLKRMLAYSAISHMGFMLLALSSGISKGYGIFALDAYMAAMFYVVTYVLTSAGAFGVILLLTRSGFEAEQISDFAGLNKRSPWLAFIMLMLMFSMAGVPFFVGFFAKFTVLRSVIAIGNIWVAIAAVFFSLVGAFYYLRVVKVMYFDAANDHARIEAPFGAKLLVSINGLAVAALGLFPHPLMQQCGVSLFRALGGGA